MINHWRGQWQQPDMPFIIVQLTNFMARQAQPVQSNWAVLRDQQRQVGTLDNTASVVTLDVGEWNDIHPVNKATIGERLALAARNIAYNQDIAYQGPVPTKAERQDDRVIVHFSHTGDGLTEASPLTQSFAIAGADNQYYWADVRISNDKVILSSAKVSQPLHVRYGWADNPEPGLFSSAGLPAAAFSMAVTSATNAD